MSSLLPGLSRFFVLYRTGFGFPAYHYIKYGIKSRLGEHVKQLTFFCPFREGTQTADAPCRPAWFPPALFYSSPIAASRSA